MYFNKEDRSSNTGDDHVLGIYIKAMLRSLVLSLILLLAAAVLFYFSTLEEHFLELAVWIITIVVICYAGVYASFRIGRRGLFHGIVIGMLYVMILILIAWIAAKGSLNLAKYGVLLAAGMIVGGLSGRLGTLLRKD